MSSINYQDLIILSGATNDEWWFNYASDEFKNLSIIPTLPNRLLGPYKVAYRAGQAGYNCKVVDFFNFIPNDKLITLLEKFVGPKTILSISTNHLMLNLKNNQDKIVIKLKEIIVYFQNKFKTKILLGGFNSKLWKDFFQADYVIEGTAENSIIDFLNSQFNFGINKIKIPIWDIKTCDFKWHKNFNIVPGETLPLETSKGCIYKCKFCRYKEIGKKRGTYVRDLGLIQESLLVAYEDFKITNYQIIDATFNDDINNIINWHKMSTNLPFKLKYATHIRADLVDKYSESALLLSESGLIGALIGLETLHPTAAKAVGKSWSAKRAKDFLPHLKQSIWKNVNMTLTAIIGLPDENFNSVHKTYRWIEENNFSTCFYPLHIMNPDFLQFDYVSEFDINAAKYGYKLNSTYGWKNNLTSSAECKTLAEIINKKTSTTTPLMCWETNVLAGMGLDHSQTMTVPKKFVLNNKETHTAIKNFIESYLKTFD